MLTVTSPVLASFRRNNRNWTNFDMASDTFLQIHLANYFLSNFETLRMVSNKAVVTKLTKLQRTDMISFTFCGQFMPLLKL